ncbi:hypothetical protein PsorP6_005473 [Peronosclerospora sorghi]|uniref:Uncharacterized protein n=1 Tax=Peronosclerospora sorghi TaxID=230839 RepID=A0ACC0W327_9STRA|nr:hypothetical protein PsorP6_005473 [Peronosclerospora sorghi]
MDTFIRLVPSGCSGAIEVAVQGLLNPATISCSQSPDIHCIQRCANPIKLNADFKISWCDEIYGDMVFGSNVFFPIATLTKTFPVVAFLIPGWRVGWIMVHDRYNVLRDARTAYLKLSQNILGANSLVQVRYVSSSCCDLDKEAALTFIVVTLHQSVIHDIITPAAGYAEEQSLVDFKKRYFATLAENAQFTIETLSKILGLEVIVPQGAMYAIVKVQTDILTTNNDDFNFTQKLLEEESVFVLPVQVTNYHVNRAIVCFGMTSYFRIVFSAPHDALRDAYNHLVEFCRRHE